jgi:hypothetical protein
VEPEHLKVRLFQGDYNTRECEKKGGKNPNLVANETLYQLSYDLNQLTIKHLRSIVQIKKVPFTTFLPPARRITCKYFPLIASEISRIPWVFGGDFPKIEVERLAARKTLQLSLQRDDSEGGSRPRNPRTVTRCNRRRRELELEVRRRCSSRQDESTAQHALGWPTTHCPFAGLRKEHQEGGKTLTPVGHPL